MARTRIVVDLSTGQQTEVPHTLEEEAEADAAYEAEQLAIASIEGAKALKKSGKDEAAALAKEGDYEAAFNKILELI